MAKYEKKYVNRFSKARLNVKKLTYFVSGFIFYFIKAVIIIKQIVMMVGIVDD